MDLMLSLVTLFALMTNALGINEQVMAAYAAMRDGSEDAYQRAQIWLGTKLSWPLALLLFANALLVGIVYALAAKLHYSILTEVERNAGIFGTFTAICAVSAIAMAVWGVFQLRWGTERYVLDANGDPEQVVIREGDTEIRISRPAPGYRPLRVSIFVSGTILLVGLAAVSVTLSLHALYVESRALWFLSMDTRYVAFMMMGVALALFAAMFESIANFLQKIMQPVVEAALALLPGVTLENVTARIFPTGFQLVNERRIAAAIGLVTTALVVVVIPYDLLVFLNPTVDFAAIYIGGPYVFTLLAGIVLRKANLGHVVAEAQERFLRILFGWGKWVFLAITLLGGSFLSSPLSHSAKHFWAQFVDGIADLFAGRTPWVYNHGFFLSVGGILLAAVAFFALWAIAKANFDKPPVWAWALIVLTTLYIGVKSVGSLVAWAEDKHALYLGERNVPRSTKDEIRIESPVVVNNVPTITEYAPCSVDLAETSFTCTIKTSQPATASILVQRVLSQNGQAINGQTGKLLKEGDWVEYGPVHGIELEGNDGKLHRATVSAPWPKGTVEFVIEMCPVKMDTKKCSISKMHSVSLIHPSKIVPAPQPSSTATSTTVAPKAPKAVAPKAPKPAVYVPPPASRFPMAQEAAL